MQVRVRREINKGVSPGKIEQGIKLSPLSLKRIELENQNQLLPC